MAAATLMLASTAPALAEIIDFEDLPSTPPDTSHLYAPVSNGYRGFDWSVGVGGIWYVSVSDVIPTPGLPGWYNGVGCSAAGQPLCTGATNATSVGGGVPDTPLENFDLISADWTASVGMQSVTFEGWRDGAMVVPAVTRTLTTARTSIAFGWNNIDELVIRMNGTPDFWVMDNLVYRPVPEPATWATLVVGLAAVIFSARRRNRRASGLRLL
jgi:hypothetical protein